jgi:uncharacterized phage protein (TIGR02220 family)
LERDFKGIWIPREVWLSKDLTLQEKIILVEINSLDGKDGCYATNDYFSEFFGYSKRRIIDTISSLEKKGYITKKLLYNGKSVIVDKRILNCTIKYFGYSSEKNCTQLGEENCTQTNEVSCTGTGEENCTDNNTLINNTNNNTNNIYIPYSEIIELLNKKANTNYRSTGKKTRDLIKARFNEGFNFYDFELVITKKCVEWLGTNFQNYLRPETLFSNKFEGYLNQKGGNNGFNKQYSKGQGQHTKNYGQGLEEGIGFSTDDL